jgi:hypothetical protein
MKAPNRKLIEGLLGLCLALPLGIVTGQAQPSAKVTAETSAAVLIPPTTGTGDWVNVLSSSIKTANKWELFVTVALETGLFTKTDAPPDAESRARIEVRVLRDGMEVDPGVVIYDRRVQRLSVEGPGEVDFSLETADASSFTFVDTDVPVGDHSIVVQARVDTGSDFGVFEAWGAVGKGTMTAESVRMPNN